MNELDEECTHRLGREEIQSTIRLSEPWQVDCDHVKSLGEAPPNLAEGQQALRPGGGQHDRLAHATARLGVPDPDAIRNPKRQFHLLRHRLILRSRTVTPLQAAPGPSIPGCSASSCAAPSLPLRTGPGAARPQ